MKYFIGFSICSFDSFIPYISQNSSGTKENIADIPNEGFQVLENIEFEKCMTNMCIIKLENISGYGQVI